MGKQDVIVKDRVVTHWETDIYSSAWMGKEKGPLQIDINHDHHFYYHDTWNHLRGGRPHKYRWELKY